MPKKVIPHNHAHTSLEGFRWDGFRLSEFAHWYKGNFCYHAGSASIIIDSAEINIGDWLINEEGAFLIVDEEEFNRDFDLSEDE